MKGSPWRSRWRQWWLERVPRSDVLELTQRNVYILPTRAGGMLGVTLLLLLVGSINYQLNLGYLLTFLLGGSALAAMHVSHANLRGLRVELAAAPAVYAGQTGDITVALHNPGKKPRYALALSWSDTTPGTLPAHHQCDAPAQDCTRRTLALFAPQRGRQALPPLLLETRFPLGTFRVWSWWRPAGTRLVYPTPEHPAPPLPGLGGSAEHDHHTAITATNSDEWDGVRPWRQGDPLKWVVWKKAAKRASGERSGWVSRDFAPQRGGPLWLDTAATGLTEREAQLSRLCAWVLAAQAQNRPYGLRLAGLNLSPDLGPHHQQRCLEALALC